MSGSVIYFTVWFSDFGDLGNKSKISKYVIFHKETLFLFSRSQQSYLYIFSNHQYQTFAMDFFLLYSDNCSKYDNMVLYRLLGRKIPFNIVF